MDDIEVVISDLSEGVEIIRKNLQCAICLELLKNPVRTRCSHSFCRECIMTVINTNRTAHCPLCNKSINRRRITEDEKVGTLVEKAQNLISNIGKDTGFDVTSHTKLPSSTCEAIIASPKFHQKKQETVSVKHEASPHKVSKPAVTTSKEQWLKRYKGSYPGKRDSRGDNIDLLSISQAEPVDQSFIARDTVLIAVESKVDKLKVPPIEKVQEWLQRNVHAFEQAPARSPESTTVTVAADVHRGLDEEIDLLSVSQQRSYIAPRKADVRALRNSSERLRCTYNKVKQASNEKRIFTSRVGNEDNTELCERVKDEQNVEDDPYEFISSQKTGTLSKKKLKRNKKDETAVQKTEVKNLEICGPSLKGDDDKNPNENNTLSCNSPPVSDFTFTCPIEMNDTFDNLVANSRKPELKKTDTTKVVAGHNNSDDMCLFRTPLEVPASSQDNGGSTTESMSDVDFSSGSSEEWGESNQMKQNPIQVSSVRTRSSSHNLPAKKSPTRSTSRPTAGKKSSGIFPRRNEKLEVLKSSSKEASKQKLQINPVKPKPLSPIKKVNLNTDVEDFNTVNMKQRPGICNDSNKRSEDEFVACLSLDKAHTGKENVICPATVKYGVNENKKNLECTAMNTTVCSRSPGWSRISQSKKDFERFKKPALKALNVSGGEVCTSKKHVISVSDVTMERDIMNEVMSPLPTIDDSDSSVGIPVVAFDSPEAPNRVEMMSRIVMDLEHQIGPNSSTGNIAEITTEAFTPHSVKDVTLKKCVSFSSDAFSDPLNALDSPKSCQRKELIHAVLSSVEDEDQLECHCNEGNERIMSGITKLSEGETDSQDNYKKVNDNVNNPVVDTTDTILIVQESNSIMAHEEATENTECNQDIHNEDNGNFTVLTVQESNSIMAHEEATENIEHNQDIHNKDTGNIKKNLVVDISETVFIVQETNSTMTHEEATKNIEHTQEKNSPVVDSNETVFAVQESSSTMAHEAATENIEHNQDKCNRDNGNIKNSPAVDSNETVFVVQESGSTMAHKEAAENTEHKQDIHTKAHGNVMKNQIVDVSRNNVLMAQDSCSATRHEEVAENTQYNQDSHNKDNDNIQKNHVFDIGKKNILMVQESHSITTRDEAMENIQRNLVLDQNIIPTESDCSKMSTSFDLKRKCDKGASLENVNNQTEKPIEAVQNGNILTEQLPANSSLAASRQDLQALILSKKCNEEKLSLSSSDIIINSKTQENSLFRPCTTKEPQLQPQIISTEPMEITTEKFHQTEIQSSCNSSVGLVNSYPNKMHIPFIKCGRLTSSKLFTKFILRGSLAPRGKNVPPETLQELSSGQPQSMNCENGTQTSPGLLDLKMNPTQVYPKLVQPTISTGTINHTQGHSEDFVPDSCESTHAFPCAIPLPQHSVARQTLKDSHKCSDPGDSLRICRTSEPLNVDIYTEDNSVESNVNMNRSAVLRNQCQYHEPGDGMEHDVSTSQFSMENTVKVQQITASPNGGHSLELPSNLVTHTGLTKPILQETNTGKTVNTDHDKCDAHTSQKAISAILDGQPDHEERKSKSHQQNKIMVPRTDDSAGWLTEDLHCKNREHKQNNYGNSFAEKGRKTTSRASRQLTFSPNFIPKLSDPTLDVNTEDGEKDVQKLHKKSYKRIRVASASSDSVSASSGSDDMSDSETREIKKPCHTSVRKASRSDKNNEVLICKEDAETSPGVIELLTSSEESNCGHIAPKGDDKTNNEGKWLEDDVPDSEELMARVMANIEADLVGTRKRKMTEGDDRQEMRESPTLFTPPPFVTDSEELGSRMTFELVVSDSEVERKKKPIKKSFLGNTAVGNDSESLSMQHRNKTQADIHNLETEVKECEAELQKVTKNTPTGNTDFETGCGDSENESEDFVEATPKGQNTSNKSWNAKAKDDVRPEMQEAHFQQPDQGNLTSAFSTVQNTGKRMLLHNPDPKCILPGSSLSGINSTEIQCEKTGTPNYESADVKPHALSPKSKQIVLQLPHKNILPTMPVIRGENSSGVIHVSSMPVNSSNTTKMLSPACVSEPVLPQSSPQISTVQRPPPGKLCFVCSGLHSGLIARVKALSKLLGAEFSNKFELHTTHLVVKASDTMMADKTLKYLSAVVKKTWIVSFAWVNACLQARKLVPEDEYEMLDSSGENGPYRSRTSSSLLYKNFEFCCIEPFSYPSREQLEGILKDCGALIVDHPEKFSFKAGHCSMIIIQMNAESEKCKEWWERYGVLPVGHEWVFECIGRYRIIPIWSFLNYAVNKDHVRMLGYPEDALASSDDDDDDDDDDVTVVESQV